jgi:hypothetical protein
MKNNALVTGLLWVASLSAVVSIILFWLFIGNERQLRDLNGQMGKINSSRPLMTALINDAIEYSKKNQAIDPLLEAIGAKAKTTPATNKPAGK